jgi:hypothetical protein
VAIAPVDVVDADTSTHVTLAIYGPQLVTRLEMP